MKLNMDSEFMKELGATIDAGTERSRREIQGEDFIGSMVWVFKTPGMLEGAFEKVGEALDIAARLNFLLDDEDTYTKAAKALQRIQLLGSYEYEATMRMGRECLRKASDVCDYLSDGTKIKLSKLRSRCAQIDEREVQLRLRGEQTSQRGETDLSRLDEFKKNVTRFEAANRIDVNDPGDANYIPTDIIDQQMWLKLQHAKHGRAIKQSELLAQFEQMREYARVATAYLEAMTAVGQDCLIRMDGDALGNYLDEATTSAIDNFNELMKRLCPESE